ncbi:hypothetical protein GOBAR_DD13342 [Gossypium barbadense]|nr:hypothetical protein GOBAR_DD13342 [Gossypium barbadense]
MLKNGTTNKEVNTNKVFESMVLALLLGSAKTRNLSFQNGLLLLIWTFNQSLNGDRVCFVYLLWFGGLGQVFFSISNLVLVSGQCQSDQRQLLLEFKSSFNSTFTSPGKMMKWNQTSDCCSWDGVSCDDGGHVIGLDLSNGIIVGAIDNSSSLFRLQHLQRLNLAFNLFINAFPTGFEKLENLCYLNLSNAGFTGQIPVEISRLTRLVTLDLSVILFQRSLELEMLVQNLTRLRFLYLDGVNISATGNKWCRALSPLIELQVLSMSDCCLSGPMDSSLSKIRSLSVIRLDHNNLSGLVPPFLAEFPNLTSLHLNDNDLSGRLPEEIFQIPTLQALDLSNNKLLEGSIKKFPLNASLQTLRLTLTHIGGQIPESIGNLGQLTRIELAFCNFSGPIPKTVKKLSQLVYLNFCSNSFSGPIPNFSSSRNLTELNLAGNQLNGTIHSTDWSGLSKLVSVDLQTNKLSGTIPPTLFGIPSLQALFLSENQFDGNIGDLHGKASLLLRYLDLRSNKLQGQFPVSLFEFHGLEYLSLSSNNFSGLIPMTAFQNLRNLSYLDLSYNRLSIDATTTNISLLSFPTFNSLGLGSCNLTGFPDFLKNQTSLNYLDLSKNKIHGGIPNWIWKAKSLSYLNLSQNFLVEFERPLRNITSTLWFLDLHGNQLHGKIPILPLHAIYLDYSNNNFNSVLPAHLVGPIPTSTQLQSFSEASFENNAGLCGPPLKATCGLPPAKTDNPSDARSTINWNYISAETGFCFGFGVSVALLIFWKRWRKWYFERMDRALSWLFPCLPLETRKHGRRATRNERRH